MSELLKQKLIWIAALGYFVDLFDLVLYGAVRVESLRAIGYQGDDIFRVGAVLLNIQMLGMIAGGFLFGIYGDRRGRMDALFGSIAMYSAATFLNAYVNDFNSYAILRFLAGFGLAGELGAAITLVLESLPQNIRGLGSAFIAAVGFLGAASASLISQQVSWQSAYRVGGALGFLLLAFRMNVRESRLFLESKTRHPTVGWGSMTRLIGSLQNLKRVTLCVAAGVPIWYVAGILSYFSPEFAQALEISGPVTAGNTIMVGYLGSILGDLLCGAISQKLKSRKKAIWLFFSIGGTIALFHPLFIQGASPSTFYWVRFAIGFGNGYFAMLIAWIAEIFGTNLRVTAASIIANLIRASVIPLTLSFEYLNPIFGLLTSSAVLGTLSLVIAGIAISRLPETFHQSIDFVEK